MSSDPDSSHVKQVRSILRNHVGSSNAITSREIANKIGIDEVGSFPQTRAVVRHLLIEEKMPIGAHSNGYFLIEDEDELNEYIGDLTRRAHKIEDRIRYVNEAFDQTHGFSLDEDESKYL